MQYETAPQNATVNTTIALRRSHSDRVSRDIIRLPPPAARSSAKVAANRLRRGKLSVAVSRSRLICRCVSPRPKTVAGCCCRRQFRLPPLLKRVMTFSMPRKRSGGCRPDSRTLRNSTRAPGVIEAHSTVSASIPVR